MNDTRNGKLYATIFLFFLVVLIVGGYYLTIKLTSENNNNNKSHDETHENEKQEEKYSDELKIDKNEEYMYFKNIDNKSLEHEMTYQDIVININSNDAITIEKELNKEMEALKKTYKKLSEQKISDEDQEKIIYKEDDIYSSTFKKYTRYFYKNYASLLSEEYDYDCFSGAIYKNSKSYVFDTTTGELLSKQELMKLYKKSLAGIKNTIKEKLEKNQTIIDEIDLIDIAATLNNLDEDDNYALYINKSGFLVISYLVKTTQVDYNDVIILN